MIILGQVGVIAVLLSGVYYGVKTSVAFYQIRWYECSIVFAVSAILVLATILVVGSVLLKDIYALFRPQKVTART